MLFGEFVCDLIICSQQSRQKGQFRRIVVVRGCRVVCLVRLGRWHNTKIIKGWAGFPSRDIPHQGKEKIFLRMLF